MSLALCDTNILIRVSKPDHPDHAATAAEITRLHAAGIEPVMVPQSCYEYYVVATRPVERNGLGMSPEEAMTNIADLLRLFRLVDDELGIFWQWRSLVAEHAVRGKRAHDTRLVASMKKHGIRRLVTSNAKDFRRYDFIELIVPTIAA